MKIKETYFAFMATAVLFGAACKKEKSPETVDSKSTAVAFSGTINGQVKTKAADNTWNPNDLIGVFMKTGNGLTTVFAANKSYTTLGDGEFKPVTADQTIYYPEDGKAVDFIAYYPYKQTLPDNTYNVDISNQSNQNAIDLLYANNAVGLTKTSSNASLVFSHQLSKVEFKLKNSIEELNGLSVIIAGLKTSANFDLGTGTLSNQDKSAEITAKTSIKNGVSVTEAILLPTTDEQGARIVFAIGAKTFTWNLPASTKFESGKKYTYEVELKLNGTGPVGIAASLSAAVTNWNDVPSGTYVLDQEDIVINPPSLGYMETPVITTDENTVLVAHSFPGRTGVRNYEMLFDKKYKMAYWVAYPLHASYIGGSGRSDDWAYDPLLPQDSQPNLSSSFGNGYDRGHQIPSGDRTATSALNATTFYYSNMTAQISSMNQGIWNNLEQQCRTWMAKSDTLYVVTGAAIKTATDQTITYSKGAAIPKYYYKALAMKKGNTYYTIAFKIENKIIPAPNNYNSFRMKVSDLEKETGYTFFPKLTNVEKETIDTNIWN